MKLIPKVLISFILIAMMIPIVYAQPPTLLWDDAVNTFDMALSKDGNYVAIATGNELRFYGKESGIPLWTSTSGGFYFSVAISADGDCVVAGGDGYVTFWKDARSRTSTSETPTWMSENLEGIINRGCLDISDDGNYVVACGTGRWVFYWANAKGRATMSESTSWKSQEFTDVSAVDLSSDGNYVAAGVRLTISDFGVAYWRNARSLTGDPQAYNWLSTEPGLAISDVAISDDGDSVAVSTVTVLSVHYWGNAKSLNGNPASQWWGGENVSFSSIDMSSDGDSVIASGGSYLFGNVALRDGESTQALIDGDGGKVYFWGKARSLAGKPQVPTWIYETDGFIHDVAIDESGDYMAADANILFPGKVYFFDFRGILLWSYPIDYADKVSISADGNTVAVGTGGADTGYLFDTGYTSSIPAVGGVLMPENKLGVIAPYIVLAMVFAAISTIFVMKKRK